MDIEALLDSIKERFRTDEDQRQRWKMLAPVLALLMAVCGAALALVIWPSDPPPQQVAAAMSWAGLAAKRADGVSAAMPVERPRVTKLGSDSTMMVLWGRRRRVVRPQGQVPGAPAAASAAATSDPDDAPDPMDEPADPDVGPAGWDTAHLAQAPAKSAAPNVAGGAGGGMPAAAPAAAGKTTGFGPGNMASLQTAGERAYHAVVSGQLQQAGAIARGALAENHLGGAISASGEHISNTDAIVEGSVSDAVSGAGGTPIIGHGDLDNANVRALGGAGAGVGPSPTSGKPVGDKAPTANAVGSGGGGGGGGGAVSGGGSSPAPASNDPSKPAAGQGNDPPQNPPTTTDPPPKKHRHRRSGGGSVDAQGQPLLPQ